MIRLSHLQHDVVRYIDDIVDRFLSDGGKSGLHPKGRRRYSHSIAGKAKVGEGGPLLDLDLFARQRGAAGDRGRLGIELDLLLVDACYLPGKAEVRPEVGTVCNRFVINIKDNVLQGQRLQE